MLTGITSSDVKAAVTLNDAKASSESSLLSKESESVDGRKTPPQIAPWMQAFATIRQAVDEALSVSGSNRAARYVFAPDSADTLFASALQYGFQQVRQQGSLGYGDMSAVMALGVALDTGYRQAISAVESMAAHPGMAEQLKLSHQKLQLEWDASLSLVIAGSGSASRFGL